jgi:arginine utilization regulatory protein
VLGKTVMGLSEQVLDVFRRYHWPGNVRELEHLIEGTMNVIEAEDIIRIRHLPRHFLPPEFTVLTEQASGRATGPSNISRQPIDEPALEINRKKKDPKNLLGQQKAREKELIDLALLDSAGNISRAARNLNISRQLLHYKMKKYGLERGSY